MAKAIAWLNTAIAYLSEAPPPSTLEAKAREVWKLLTGQQWSHIELEKRREMGVQAILSALTEAAKAERKRWQDTIGEALDSPDIGDETIAVLQALREVVDVE